MKIEKHYMTQASIDAVNEYGKARIAELRAKRAEQKVEVLRKAAMTLDPRELDRLVRDHHMHHAR